MRPDPMSTETLDDQKILELAHVVHEEEIAKAKLAARRAVDPRVRALAKDSVRWHQRAVDQGEQVARTSGIVPADSETSTWLRDKEQKQLVEIAAKQGEALDRAYLESRVDAQSTLLKLIDDKMLPAASDEAVKALVENTRPVVVRDLQKALKLQIKVKE